jgi:hypothetical protein
MSDNIDSKRLELEFELIKRNDLRLINGGQISAACFKCPYPFISLEIVFGCDYGPISDKTIDLMCTMMIDRHRVSIFNEENIFICKCTFFEDLCSGITPTDHLPSDLRTIDVLYIPIRKILNSFTYWLLAVVHIALKTATVYNSNEDPITDMKMELKKVFKFLDDAVAKSTRKDKSSQIEMPRWTITIKMPTKLLLCDRDDSGVSMLLNLNLLTLHLPVLDIPQAMFRLMRYFMISSMIRGSIELCDGNVLRESVDDEDVFQSSANILCDIADEKHFKRQKNNS